MNTKTARSALPTEGSSLWKDQCYCCTIKPLESCYNTEEQVKRFTRYYVDKYLKLPMGFYYEVDKDGTWHSHGSFYERPNLYIKRLVGKERGWRIFIEKCADPAAWDNYVKKDQAEAKSPRDPLDCDNSEYMFVDE